MFQKDAFQPDALQVGGEAKKLQDAFQVGAFQQDAFEIYPLTVTASNVLVSQFRPVFQMVFARIFGRIG